LAERSALNEALEGTMLMSERNTPATEKRVLRAARYRLGAGHYQADFEHGQWWVTCLSTGAQWSVVDCQTQNGVDYLDFEQVSRGEEE
jgi:predicted cupin superfamily sugar epimerase